MPLGFTWNRVDRVYVLTEWGKKFEDDAKSLGVKTAREQNPVPTGLRQGKMLSTRGALTLLSNIRKFNDGTLIPLRGKPMILEQRT